MRIPNKEVSQEYVNAISTMNWYGVTGFAGSIHANYWKHCGKWMQDAVAAGIEKAHEEISILQYNDENALSCTINLAFYFAREYYTIVRELPAGKGFADVCLIPRESSIWINQQYIIELKWDKSAAGALEQIKEKQYAECIESIIREIYCLVGINYDKITKEHTCVIEKAYKGYCSLPCQSLR